MRLQIFREDWSATAAALLAPAIVHDPLCDLGMLADFPLYMVRNEAGEPLAAYLLKVETTPNGNEGVIVAAGANHCRGIDMTKTILPFIEQQLVEQQLANCDYVRIHTARAGLAKKLIRQGYELREQVFAKQIGGVSGAGSGCGDKIRG